MWLKRVSEQQIGSKKLGNRQDFEKNDRRKKSKRPYIQNFVTKFRKKIFQNFVPDKKQREMQKK